MLPGTEYGEAYRTTQALLRFENCVGGIYSVEGRDLDIKGYWKGNDTIIYETKKEYKPYVKHHRMQCFSEKVKVIYLEK